MDVSRPDGVHRRALQWCAFLSKPARHCKFGHSLQDREKLAFGFNADSLINSSLHKQGMSFFDYFNSFL
jgi:homoserine O-acetyltransferase